MTQSPNSRIKVLQILILCAVSTATIKRLKKICLFSFSSSIYISPLNFLRLSGFFPYILLRRPLPLPIPYSNDNMQTRAQTTTIFLDLLKDVFVGFWAFFIRGKMQSLENDPIIPIWYRQQAFCHFHFIFIEPKLESDSKKKLLKYRNDCCFFRYICPSFFSTGCLGPSGWPPFIQFS